MKKTVVSSSFSCRYSLLQKIKLFLFYKKRHYYSSKYKCYIKKNKIIGNSIDGVVYGEPYNVSWNYGRNV